MENICYSGGADGADIMWGETALIHKHNLIHFMFGSHKNITKIKQYAKILTKEELLTADPTLLKVNKVLKRSFPAHSDYVSNLLRRDYFQVKDSDAVYAIAGIDGNTVFGGTAWAVESFKVLYPDSHDIYVFDQSRDEWYEWCLYLGFPHWEPIDNPPVPQGRWTGIGTRSLEANGRSAILGAFQA